MMTENRVGSVRGLSGEISAQCENSGLSHEAQACPACAFSRKGNYWFPADLEDAALNSHGGTHAAHEYDAVLVAMDEFTAAAAEKYDEFVAEWARRRERVLEWRGMTSSLHPAPKAAS